MEAAVIDPKTSMVGAIASALTPGRTVAIPSAIAPLTAFATELIVEPAAFMAFDRVLVTPAVAVL